ncbi:tectonic-1-like isoform X1 [Pieris brassicae]|uniref:tectonic-1-like isoform X1 n=1 Tax=Pieris brassicae TaxID=7116 RepID=UPI001E661583|nr:tectonic-1-like isoform X1 [Pieris brassicae]
MQPITYLVFTLVSILIQFCVMDFINDTIEEKNKSKMLRRNLHAMARIVEKPHGLFYQTLSNISIDMTTEMSSTILDWVYDENISTTEENLFTDITTSDYENVTEVTLFKNITTKPSLLKKSEGRCGCNILYQTCDINCCCDTDCSDTERMLFSQNCKETYLKQFIHPCSSGQMKQTNFLENLFCISKTNLPDKRLTDIQFDEAAIYRYPRWRISDKQEESNELGFYKYNDPIWLMNESRFQADIPMAFANNYCNDKRRIRFLINENVKCIVKLQELHMFEALKAVNNSVLSMGETINTTKSETFHTNWTLVICDDNQCRAYNKTGDEPHCTDIYCENIATTVQYNFYYYNSRITKAVLKLHVQKVSMRIPFITQTIQVKFYLSNDSIENVTKLSGNPGYNWGLPIIISSAESNHTLHFFNKTNMKRILTYPDNRNGKCLSSNVRYKIVQFGHNKRSKCRYHIQQIDLKNGTTACHLIQNQILNLLGLNSTLYISPYGNPERLSDERWLRLQIVKTYIYGMFKNNELTCHNIIARIGYVMAYESEQLVYVNVEGTAQNITFDIEDISTVVTVDTSFIELRKSLEFAGAPHLNINLPKNFF